MTANASASARLRRLGFTAAARPMPAAPPAPPAAQPLPASDRSTQDQSCDEALGALHASIATTLAFEQELRGGGGDGRRPAKGAAAAAPPVPGAQSVAHALEASLEACVASRKRAREAAPADDDLSDEALSQYTRFTKQIALAPYTPFLHYVPRLVNVVHRALASVALARAARPRRAALIDTRVWVCR
tara:strand:- start:131 stop:694 length:564 start_codon:yes stop_codon:yes gene_type:complete